MKLTVSEFNLDYALQDCNYNKPFHRRWLKKKCSRARRRDSKLVIRNYNA